LLTYNLEFQSS